MGDRPSPGGDDTLRSEAYDQRMAGNDPLDAALLEGLADLPIEEVRSRRGACQAIETQLSYVRRLVQGRLDIVLHEMALRRGEGARNDDVVADLAATLADRIHAPGNGHLPTAMAPGDIDPDLQATLDRVAPPGPLSDPKSMGDEEIRAVADGLADFEQEVSARRRAMFERIDGLQAEIIRRYRTGEASVDTLLRGSGAAESTEADEVR